MKKLFALLLAVVMLVPAFALADNVIKIGVKKPTGNGGRTTRKSRGFRS